MGGGAAGRGGEDNSSEGGDWNVEYAAWRGAVWWGKARYGEARQGVARLGVARQGKDNSSEGGDWNEIIRGGAW
ncbi:hypothetical protein ES703_105938 [subsurface metagenome]